VGALPARKRCISASSVLEGVPTVSSEHLGPAASAPDAPARV
jgi:hypothetical protein